MRRVDKAAVVFAPAPADPVMTDQEIGRGLYLVQNAISLFREKETKIERQRKMLSKLNHSRLSQREHIRRMRRILFALVDQFGQRKMKDGHEVLTAGDVKALQAAFAELHLLDPIELTRFHTFRTKAQRTRRAS